MFYDKYTTGLEMFNLQHIITLAVLTLIMVVFIFFVTKVKQDSKQDKVIRYVIASALLIFEICYYIYWIKNGRSDLEMIPFTGFCATTNVLTIYYLFANDKKVANIVFYYALTGSFFSLIFVSISNSFPHFRFIHYFHNHFVFMLVAVYGYVIGRVKITRKYFNISAFCLFVYTLILLAFDYLLDENWFFFKENPVKIISDFLGPILYPPLWILTIYLLMNVWYFMFKGINKLRFKNIDQVNLEN